MEHYIDKDALIDEINKRITDAPVNYIGHQRVWAYNDVKEILDAIEVKDVDLDKEIDEHWDEWQGKYGFHFYDFAKHFFELGMTANNKVQK